MHFEKDTNRKQIYIVNIIINQNSYKTIVKI